MKLYIARHGDSLAKEIDPTRPLSEKGEADIKKIAAFIKKFHPEVDAIFHSGIVRAEQTAELLAKAFDFQGSIQAHTNLNPIFPVAGMLNVIKYSNDSILLVGHLPFVENLVSSLCCGGKTQNIVDIVAFEPGTIVCLERIENNHDFWVLQWILKPDIL